MAIQVTAVVDNVMIESSRVRLREGDTVTLTAHNDNPPNPPSPAGQWVRGVHNTDLNGETSDTLTITMDLAQDTSTAYAFKSGDAQSKAITIQRSTLKVSATVDDGTGAEPEASPYISTPGDVVTLTARDNASVPRELAGERRKDEKDIPVATIPTLRFTVSSTGADLGVYRFHDSLDRVGEPFTLTYMHVTVSLIASLDGEPGFDITKPIKVLPAQDLTLRAVGDQDPDIAVLGEWEKNSTTMMPPVKGPELTITMNARGTAAGSYTFVPESGDISSVAVVENLPPPKWYEQRGLLTWLVERFLQPGLVVLLILAVLTTGSIFLLRSGTANAVDRSWMFAIFCLVAFAAIVQYAGHSRGGTRGISSLFIGQDRRVSTSKTQAMMWTLLVGGALAYIVAFSLTAGADFQCASDVQNAPNCLSSSVWPTYLVLLGVPAGAAVAAKGLTTYKVQNGIVQKTEAESPSTLDLTNNDANSPDLVDIQYLLFNLIAFGYVAAFFVDHRTLPEVPDALLVLTSAAAGTYVFNKALQSNPPVITSVVPSRVAPGDVIVVSGENLLIAEDGTVPTTVEVKVGGVPVPARPIAGEKNSIQLTAPPGMSPDDATVRVVTSAHIESDGFPITIAGLEILGWARSALPSRKSSARVQLRVLGLPARDFLDERINVNAGGLSVPGRVERRGVISFVLPAMKRAEVEVTAAFRGQVSPAVKLPLG